MRRQGGDVCYILYKKTFYAKLQRRGETTRPPCTHKCAPVHIVTKDSLACKNSRFSSLLAAGGVQRRGTSTTQRQKFHTDLTTVFASGILMSHSLIALRLLVVVACVNAYNGLLLEGENHYPAVSVCLLCATFFVFLMLPLRKKYPVISRS